MEIIGSIILASIGLLLVMKVFYAFFLTEPVNLSVAKDNMLAIQSFIDYSNDRFSNSNIVCTTLFKLKNLNSYQVVDDDRAHYFYAFIVRGSDVYLEIYNYKEVYNKITNINDNEEFANFLRNVKPKKRVQLDGVESLWDIEVDEGSVLKSFLNANLPFDFFDSEFSNRINFERPLLMLILFPKSGGLRQNNYKVFGLSNDYSLFKIGDSSSYLVFVPNDGRLFVTSSSFEDLLVSRFMCIYEDKFVNDLINVKFVDENGNLINKDEMNFNLRNYNIDASVKDRDVCNYNFAWTSKGPVCYEDGKEVPCWSLLRYGGPTTIINFENFYKYVKEFYINKKECYGEEGVLKFSIVEVDKKVPLSFSEFSYLEPLVDENGKFIDFSKFNNYERRSGKYAIYDLRNLWESSRSLYPEDFVSVINNDAYFYSGSINGVNYYSRVKLNSLRKKMVKLDNSVKSYELYFGNQKLVYVKKVIGDRFDSILSFHLPSSDDYTFYLYKLNIDGKSKLLYLTKSQIDRIKYFSEVSKE